LFDDLGKAENDQHQVQLLIKYLQSLLQGKDDVDLLQDLGEDMRKHILGLIPLVKNALDEANTASTSVGESMSQLKQNMENMENQIQRMNHEHNEEKKILVEEKETLINERNLLIEKMTVMKNTVAAKLQSQMVK